MQNLTLDEISERIAKSILEDNILTFEGIKQKVKSLCRIWVRQQKQPKKKKAVLNMYNAVNIEKAEKQFWKREATKDLSEKEKQSLYNDLDLFIESLNLS